jgi:hypothetical protein
MKRRAIFSLTLGALALSCAGLSAQTQAPGGLDNGVSGPASDGLALTPAQRAAIYRQVSRDKSKTAAKEFSPVVGADVPPMIELYALPDDAAAEVPAVKLYKYTLVANKVVLVDPTRMRVIDVIGPSGGR